MKRNFTRILAAFALLVFTMPSLVAWGQTWELATSIQTGDVVVLVTEYDQMELTGISSTSTKYGIGTEYQTVPAATYPLTVVAGASEGTFAFKNGNNYLYWTSGNSLNVNSTLSANTSWTISFDGTNATILNSEDAARQIWWNVGSPRFACYTDKTHGNSYHIVSLYKQVVNMNTVATPTITPNGGNFLASQEVSLACTTDGATIYYTLDGNDPTTSSNVYSVPFTITETTTVKALAVKTGLTNSDIATAILTKATAMTVAEARAAIDAGTGVTGVYVTGIVSAIPYSYTSNNGITFNMVDNSGDTDFLQAYKCQGAEAPNVAIDDIVVVYGNLTKYNSTYEFAQGCQVVSLTHPSVAVEAPTFNPAEGVFEEAQNVTITCATEGASIYYTTDGTEPTNSSTPYTTAINVATTTTIKAIAYLNGEASTVATATYTIVTLNNISDITEVGTAYMVQGTVVATNSRGFVMGDGTGYVYYYKNAAVDQSLGDKVKVSGTTGTYGQIIQFTNSATVTEVTGSNYNNTPAATVITEVPDYTSGYHLSTYLEFEGALAKDNNNYLITLGNAQIQISYPTSDQGTTLTALNGKNVRVKGYFAGINSSSKFTVMLESVVSTTPVINVTNNNITLAYDDIEGSIPYTITNPVAGTTLNANCTAEWISNITVGNENITFTCTANEGTEDRTATFILAYQGAENVTVTITQGHYVVDYATLPFEFDGGKAAIETTAGLTQNGLGSDYNSSPKLKFDGTGDYVILKFNEEPGKLAFDIKGNTFSGGTFKVQTSTNGETYTDLSSYTTLGDTEHEVFNTLGSDVRYIKWIYTNKSSGNVALGNITLDKPTSAPIIVVTNNTVSLAYDETSGSINYSITNPVTGTILTATSDDTWISNITVGEGTITFTATENEGTEDRTATITLSYEGAEDVDVTVTQGHPTAPGDQYELFSGGLVEGDYLIVYDNSAMNNTVLSDRLQYVTVTATNNVITTDNAAIVWHIAPSGEYWTIYSADANAYAASTGAKNKAQMLVDGTDDMALWTVSGTETFEFVNKKNTANSVNANLRKNGTYGFACYATSTGGALSLYKKVESVTPSFDLAINGWDPNPSTGTTTTPHDYYLIASPLVDDTDPVDVTNMLSPNYNLYRFNQFGATNSQGGIVEWENYKQHQGDFFLEKGKGYLYAHNNDVTLTFIGTPVSGDSYNVTLTNNASNGTRGKWNLVGNSFTVPANIGSNRSYYKMNADGTDVVSTTGGTIGAMEGIFVLYDENATTVTFTKGAVSKCEILSFNITQGRSEAIDRAIVRFDEGQELPKFQIDPNHTKLYIPQSEDNYAVVRATTDGVMPLNFKAQTNGNYTISINVENVELNTLVLIDNLTGNEVNLLSRAEYSFDATTEDDENRFTLVYSKSGETKTYKLTITADDFNTTSYAANNTEKTSNAVNVDDPTDTYEVVWASNQVMKNASGQMQWKKGEGRIYNITNMGSITDVTVDGISGGFTTYYGESIEPAWSGITGQPFFQTKTYDDAVGYSTSLEVTFDIEEGAATTYSVTFDAGEGTFVGNEDFPNTENTKAAGIYTLPDATREGYVFNGWLATGTTTPRTGSYTVYTDVEFTAQYTENGASGGNGGTDVLDLEFTGVSGTNYTSWSDKEGESGAVYAGNSAGGNSAIQLRSSNNNSGIITTASGGMISKVVVTWNENTTNGRVLNVYGKNTAYTAVTDLYNSSKQGTLLGTITCGTSTELLVSDEYTFIGLRSNSGAMYIDEISITWVLPSNVATPTFSPAAGTYMGTQTVTISCETDGAVIYYTTDGTTPDNTSTLYDGGITVSETTTIQAIAYVDDEASHVASATYTIVVPQTIAEVREQGTGTVLTYGVVTAVSTNSNGTTAYMQDMTAAIVVYGDFTAEVGDEIQVSGTLTTFRGLLEIGTPTVTVASQNNVIDPTVMTIAEIIEDAEGDNEYQAMLVSIVEATVAEINGNNTIIAQGENTITVYGSLGDVEEDDVISFTGNIGCYNTVQIVNPTNIEIQGNTTMPTFFIDGDWFDGANWTTGEVPAAGSNVTIAANATVNDGYIAVVNEMNITSEGSLTIADGGQVKSNTSFVANLQKNITGYGNGTGKYYLITVPASVDMCSVDGFMPMDNTLHNQVDFYAFDQQHEGEEWLNYKYGYDYFAGPYVTHRGVGYLYANKNNTTLNFASVGYSVPQGSTVNYYESPFQPTNVDFNAEIDYNSGVVFAGYNLLGNPFTCNAYLVGNYQFYRMNPDGDAIIAANPGDEIKPGEGIFVVVSSVDDEIIFTAEEPVLNKSCLAINLSDGQSLKDRAIVRFDEDRNIGKFMFNENGAKLYITQDGKDCSVVGSEGIGEMPVNFKAAQNGTYTLSFSNDNVEFSYLHLIDNMTGAEVDLLANPSYSFEAKSSDYASRFKLVFVVNEDNLNNNDNFAFVSNGNIVINGEGTLQVIDMTGRIVSVEEVNGMSSVNVNAAGVYVLQLTNGESVKTQKIVVK